MPQKSRAILFLSMMQLSTPLLNVCAASP